MATVLKITLWILAFQVTVKRGLRPRAAALGGAALGAAFVALDYLWMRILGVEPRGLWLRFAVYELVAVSALAAAARRSGILSYLLILVVSTAAMFVVPMLVR